jgi:predicted transcriptional regulator
MNVLYFYRSLLYQYELNRSREKISADILSAAQEPILKTLMMYKANLSFDQLKTYMQDLEEKRFIQRSGPNHWVITNEGRAFLRQYQLVAEIIG